VKTGISVSLQAVFAFSYAASVDAKFELCYKLVTFFLLLQGYQEGLRGGARACAEAKAV
jgi:hypothetical protein